MENLEWHIEDLILPLKFSWKISRNTSDEKHNLIVAVKKDSIIAQSEIAFNIRYGESLETTKAGFLEFQAKYREVFTKIKTDDDFFVFLQSLNLHKSLSFAIESAYTHLQARLQGQKVWQYLKCPEPKKIITSFSLPILEREQIAKFITDYNLSRFQVLKLKLGKEMAAEKINELLSLYPGKLRIDANEAWQSADEVLKIISKIKDISKIEFIEQPLPATETEEAKKLFSQSPVMIFADEAITNSELDPQLARMYHGINVKLMKAGGYQMALKQLRQAKALGMQRMLGCMIESSMGIWSAMQITGEAEYYDLDGFLIIKEDSFSLVNEENGYLSI